ncbi:MAG: cupin [Flavobacteriaceae bacterium]|nr:MAG: cupin [Flavobacteriaceae bacterium]
MIDINKKFETVTDYFSPKIIGEVNDVYVKIVKVKGEDIPWHNHEHEDELFYVLEGSLLFEEEGKDSFTMNAGNMYTVKKGINHRISSKEECKLMLIENKTTAHTGTVKATITKSLKEQS